MKRFGLPAICLNTLTVGQPLVGSSSKWGKEVSLSVSIPSQLGSLLLDSYLLDCGNALTSQYPHSWAASCWHRGGRTFSAGYGVSIPSQLGSLLLVPCWPPNRRFHAESQYPHSWAASCWFLPARCALRRVTGLNTLTVGQPLVGRALRPPRRACYGLNTLTVGQPLVGLSTHLSHSYRRKVSIPSQLGSLLLGDDPHLLCEGQRSQYPHSWAASCWDRDHELAQALFQSQYPHSWAASCWFSRAKRTCSTRSLNTLTVGQPLVGESGVSPWRWP